VQYLQGRWQKNFRERPTKKRPKISKKYRKIALFNLFQGGKATKKRPKNNTFKPLSTIFVPCLKIQGGPRSPDPGHAPPPLPPAADAHEYLKWKCCYFEKYNHHNIGLNISPPRIQLRKFYSTKLNSGFDNYMTWYDIPVLMLQFIGILLGNALWIFSLYLFVLFLINIPI